MLLQNIYAPVRNFLPNFNDVFAQVIKLGHFYVAANQSLIKLFTLCTFAASSG